MTQLSREDLIKHWLLNTAIEFHRPLLHLLPKTRGMTLNAPDVPGCTPQDYAAGLMSLFQLGYVNFSSEDPRDDVNSKLGVQTTLERFLAYQLELPEERYAREKQRIDPLGPRVARVEFALTELGGALWESVAKPEWNRFLDSGVVIGERDYKSGDVVSPDQTLLMAHLGWFTELNSDVRIDVESLEVQEHTDYPILYWKKLQHIYRATFKCNRSEPRWPRRPNFAFRPAPAWFESWRRTTYQYYAQPWELPSWPSA